MRSSVAARAFVLAAVALCHSGCGDGRSAPIGSAAAIASAAAPLFREITTATGLNFRHHVTIGGDYALPEVMSGGVAVFDANGDGRLDLYFVDAGDTRKKGAPDRLYLRTEEGGYRDATEGAGLDQTGYGMGVAAGDVDNDGDIDLYVANWGPDGLFLNDGKGRFQDVTARAGIVEDEWSASVAFVDYDLDGFLDIYVTQYAQFDATEACSDASGRRDYCGPEAFDGVPDTLFHNRGDGTFEDVSARSGIAAVARTSLGVIVEDFDGDGWPDIYSANDGHANELWINQKNGRFVNEALAMGVAVSGSGVSQASMGVTMADVEGDGDLDLFITNLTNECNILYVRTGVHGFDDLTVRAGLAAPSRSHTGFGAVLFDADHDGDVDLGVVNGRVTRAPQPLADANLDPPHWNAYADRNQLYLNDGKGVFTEGGAGDFGSPSEVFRALAAADLDDDGDLDLVTTALASHGRIFENVRSSGHWLKVRVRDERLKRDVFNARVAVTAGSVTQQRTVQSAISYLTSCVTPVHFGLGASTTVDAIVVTWPGGEVERFPGGPADREVTLVRGAGLR